MDGKTAALFEAVETGNLDSVDYLIRHEWACVHCLNDEGQTLLMIAAEKGSMPMVKKLIGYGVPINFRDRERRNALFHAALGMVRYAEKDELYKEIIQALKEAGMQSKCRDTVGFTIEDYVYISQFVERE